MRNEYEFVVSYKNLKTGFYWDEFIDVIAKRYTKALCILAKRCKKCERQERNSIVVDTELICMRPIKPKESED